MLEQTTRFMVLFFYFLLAVAFAIGLMPVTHLFYIDSFTSPLQKYKGISTPLNVYLVTGSVTYLSVVQHCLEREHVLLSV